jgi:hypothetical protein
VEQAVADAVDARFASTKARMVARGRRPGGRPRGEGSKYLLSGLLRCGVCGGGMEVLSSVSKGTRRFHYRCFTRRRKGASRCTNTTPLSLAAADATITTKVEKVLLDPRIVARALRYAEEAIAADAHVDARPAIEAELVATETAIKRLTAAIVAGGALDSLVSALKNHEDHRRDLQRRLQAIGTAPAAEPAGAVRQRLGMYASDLRGLLHGEVKQAQQILRQLLVGPLTVTPKADGGYRFNGKGTVWPVLAGSIHNLASPAGFAIHDQRKFQGIWRSDRRAA